MYNRQMKVCAVCGKMFYPAVMHKYKRVWKRRTYLACSYTCYTKLEKSVELEKEKAKYSKLSTK